MRLFLFALALRVLVLISLRDSPTFVVPVMDEADYDALARSLVGDTRAITPLFWQSVAYPLWLTVVYFCTNSSIFAARLLQIVVGAAACVLTCALGKKLFDERIGRWAGIAHAVYGPCLFFDTQLLPASWATFLGLLFALLAVEREPLRRHHFALGFVGALAIVTHPVFLPVIALVIGALWLRKTQRPTARQALRLALGLTVVLLPISVLRLSVTGSFGFLPASGGINLHIGNNLERERTVALRAGAAWDELAGRAKAAGARDLWEEDAYFRNQTSDYITAHPAHFLRNMAAKTVEFLSPRELPRTFDLYAQTQYSWLLKLTLWQVFGFGFPFGVIAIFAFVGAAVRGRELALTTWLILILYPLAVIAVFPAARYRLPWIPFVLVVAAAGLATCLRAPRKCAPWLAIATVVVGALCAVRPHPQEAGNFAAELHSLVGSRLWTEGHAPQACEHFIRAAAADPENPEILAKLGEAQVALGRLPDGIASYRRALAVKRDALAVHHLLGVALLMAEDFESAVTHFREALRLNPDYAEAHGNLGVALQRLGQSAAAIAAYSAAVAIEPRNAGVLQNLGVALAQTGEFPRAIQVLEQAIAAAGRNGNGPKLILAQVLRHTGETEQARALLREILATSPNDPGAISLLHEIDGR
ncbi:MAG: tetratricopeptide repeat protein [Planctomycetota bacterium]